MGYSSELKGYWLFSTKTKKLVISRDVVFDEFAAWSWKTSPKEETKIFGQISVRENLYAQPIKIYNPSGQKSPNPSQILYTSPTVESPPPINVH